MKTLLSEIKKKNHFPIDSPKTAFFQEFEDSGVNFVSSSASITRQYQEALRRLSKSFLTAPNGKPMLIEGGVYQGCWLESTGTINAELLSRFAPKLAESTFSLFSDYARNDGLIPYKILSSGAAWRQIQMVTPLSRSFWNHAKINNYFDNENNPKKDKATIIQTMYQAMKANDTWLSENRNTLKTGCVEAFCTFDTGHDLSSRFWHSSDTCYSNDPSKYDPDSALLPFAAPDLTANVACQRKYLARIAKALGLSDEAQQWEKKADDSQKALFATCFDKTDNFFYDRDRHGRLHRIQSDVLLRVLACEIGDASFFEESLRRYLLNTRKFFAKYPFTSIAFDDPRHDPSSLYNTWGGVTNALTVIRAAHAFEYHGRIAEQLLAARPMIQSFYGMKNFAQCINPWNGEEGYTENYSPSILGLLDFTERFCGIMHRPEGTLWFSGISLQTEHHGPLATDESAYRRRVMGIDFILLNQQDGCSIFRDGELLMQFPRGIRIETDLEGNLKNAIGMVPRTVEGSITYEGKTHPCTIGANEVVRYSISGFESIKKRGMILPVFE